MGNLGQFLERVKSDPELFDRLSNLSVADVPGFVKIASEEGFDFSVAELEKLMESQNVAELGDDELEEVTGGATPAMFAVTTASILPALEFIERRVGGGGGGAPKQPSTYVRGGTAYNDCI